MPRVSQQSSSNNRIDRYTDVTLQRASSERRREVGQIYQGEDFAPFSLEHKTSPEPRTKAKRSRFIYIFDSSEILVPD